ncbi:MAG: hypothetical protein QOI38_335, partial [Sphingomonadales bacterium]|nr:hypothetical protein [Sphingomonadales bacterium]
MSADMSVIRETTLLTDGDETSSTTPPPGNVDPGDVLYHKLIITNGGTTDATEVTIEDTFSGETMIAGTLNVSPIAFNDSFTAVGNTVLRVGTAGQQALGTNGNPSGNPSLIVLANVLSNDRGSSTLGTGVIAGDNIQGFQVRPATGTSSQDGSFTMFADGSFTYVNQAGDIGVDTFTYIIEDAGLDGNYATTGDNLTSMGTVSVTLTGEVWYVDGGAVSNGTGTSANPFNSITNLNTANKDGAGDTIYVKGLGIGAIVLEANQQLIGSGADLKVAGFTLANAGSNSTISSSGTNGYTVTVATNNTIAGIEIVGNGTNTGGITDNQAGSFGTLNLNPAALNAGTPGYQSTVNASGAALNLSDGTIAGNGLSSTTSMGSGAIVNNVSLTNITGTLALGTGLMTNASGASFNVSGGTVSTSYTGVLNHGLATGSLVSVSGGHATGTIAFTTGTLFSSAGGGLVFNDADGIYSLTGTTTINGGTSGLAITNGSSGSVSIGGTATMGATTSVGGIAITVADSTASLNFDMDVTHNTNFAILDVTNHSGGTLTFQTTATLDATNGTGLQFSNADGTYTMSSANVLHGGDAGIDIDTGSGGSFAFISNTAITNPTGDAFVVDNSTARVTFGGSITDNSGRVVHINQHDTTNNITFSTTSSIAATAGSTGILIQESNTGGTIAFNGQVQLTTTTNTAVTLTNNTGKTINFNADDLGLDITTTSGSGIVASNGGTITVSDVGSGNTINVTAGGGGGAVAFSALSTTIGAGGVTFDSINQTGGTNGIVLNGTGTGAFTVLGDQSQTSGLYDRDGSGGTISGTSGHAIALTNASNVTIRQMNLTNPTNVGSDGVNSNGGGSIRLQAVNIDAGGDSGWEAINLGGVNEFTHNSRVTDWQTVQSRGITVTNTNTNFTSFTIQNALFTTSATGADGFLFDAEGATSGDISVKNSEFTLLDDDGVQINNDGSGTIDAVIQGNNFHDADNTSGDGNNTLFLALAGSGKLNFQVGGLNPGEGNTFNNLARVQALTGAVAVNAATTGVSGGQLNGKIEGNTISNIFRRDAISFGIEANASTQGVHTIEVNNNVMNTNIGLMGIRTLLNSVAGGTLSGTNLTFKNNNIGNTGQSPLVTDDSRTGIEIESNWDNFASGGDMTTNVLLQGNTITNNGNGSGVGDTVEITVRGGNVGTNHIFNLTMFGNNMTNTGGANVLDILASPGTSQGTGVTLSVDLNSDNVPANANNTTNNAGAAGQIELRNNTTGGLFRIEDLGANAVATFVSQRNNNDTVLPTGVITTTGEVTMPTGASAFVSAEAPPPAAPIVVPVVEEPEQPAPTGSGTGDGGTGGTPDPDTDTGTGAPTGPVVVDDAVLSQAELDLIVDA